MRSSFTHFMNMNSSALLSTQNGLHAFWTAHLFTPSVLTLGSTHGNLEKSTKRYTGLKWWLIVISDYWPQKQQSNAYSRKHYHQTILSNKILKKVSYPNTVATICNTGCHRRNGPNFGRVFLMLNYTDITQNTYIQSW